MVRPFFIIRLLNICYVWQEFQAEYTRLKIIIDTI